MIKEFRKVIQGKLVPIVGSGVYYINARDSHPANYVTYTIEQLSFIDFEERGQIEVNVMGYGTDSSTVEDLTDAIREAFDHQSVLTDDLYAVFYFNRSQPVTEEDRLIIRRRLVIDYYLTRRN